MTQKLTLAVWLRKFISLYNINIILLSIYLIENPNLHFFSTSFTPNERIFINHKIFQANPNVRYQQYLIDLIVVEAVWTLTHDRECPNFFYRIGCKYSTHTPIHTSENYKRFQYFLKRSFEMCSLIPLGLINTVSLLIPFTTYKQVLCG